MIVGTRNLWVAERIGKDMAGGPVRLMGTAAVRLAAAVVVVGLAACTGPDAAGPLTPARTTTPNGGPPITGPTGGAADPETGYLAPANLWRPWQPPPPRPDGACPVDRPRPVSGLLGEVPGPGPVYPRGVDLNGRLDVGPPDGHASEFGGEYGGQKVLWVGDEAYAGPVLIRGAGIDGRTPVRFWRGADPAASMQLPPGAGAAVVADEPGRFWPSYTRVKTEGCYAWRVDGENFGYTVVFEAV
jgi:hypothetical protein